MKTKELVLQYVEARTALRQCLLESLKVDLKELFSTNPEITGIMWTQYAPHFNDGEPCVFSVNEMHYCVKEFDPAQVPRYPGEDDEEDGWNYVDNEAPTLLQEFLNNIQALDDNLMQELFGSDSQIVITPTELLVEDYSERHD
jgi:hypothetical protein